MSGLSGLRRIQIGKETAKGTAVAADTMLIGKLTAKTNYNFYRPTDHETGILSEYIRSESTGKRAELSFESDLNYEQAHILFGMIINGDVTPTVSNYVQTYDFTPVLDDHWEPDTYTFQFGDDHQAYRSTMCFGRTLQISGSVDSAVLVDLSISANDIEKTTFTSGLSMPEHLECAKTDLARIYIDDSWSDLGDTVYAASVIDFSWTITEGLEQIKYLDGTLHASDISEKKRHVELEMTIAHNGTFTTDIWNAFLSQTPLFIRIELPGSGNNCITLDGSFIIDNPEPLSETNSLSTVKVRFISVYDPESEHEWAVTLTTDE